MTKILINVATDGYSEGLCLSPDAIIMGYEIGLFTKEDYDKRSDSIYYNIDRHNPLLIQIYEKLGFIMSNDDIVFIPAIVEIDSDRYAIVRSEDGSEKVITDNNFNWIKIK